MSPEEVATIRTYIEHARAIGLPGAVPGDEVLALIASHEQLHQEAEQLRGRLASARTVWTERRQAHQRRLETGDGGAGVASICADIYAKVIKELNLALDIPVTVNRDGARSALNRFRRYLDEDFRQWCSPHGVASQYAPHLIKILDQFVSEEQTGRTS